MKALIEKFGTNQEKEQAGAWIYYDENLAFKVKRLCKRNKAYKVAIERVEKEVRRNKITESQGEEKVIEIFVDSALLDWKGVTNDEEKPIKFSKKAAMALFTDPRWPEFFDDLHSKAFDNEYFNDLEIESKN